MSGLIQIAAAALASTPAPAPDLQAYFRGAVVCQSKAARPEICRLWLNADGSYQIFYDLGPMAQKPKTAKGPFELEGREGRYAIERREGGASALCLTPAPSVDWTYGMQVRGLLFGAAECTPFEIRQPGQRWTATDRQGRDYTLWLIEGR